MYAGTPSIFIRLAGCPLRCRWCDTPYAWDYQGGADYSVQEIMDVVNKWQVQHVVVTGGEPLVGPDRRERIGLKELLTRLQQENHYVTVETAGLVFIENLPCDLISISPKLKGSHEAQNHSSTTWPYTQASIVRRWLEVHPYQMKFVVDSPDDMNEITSFLEALGDYDRVRVMLMPQARTCKELLEKAPMVAGICRDMNVTFGQRLQILLWDGRRGW